MKPLIVMQTPRRASLVAQIFAALTLMSSGTLSCAAAEVDQSHVGPPAGDGWQALSSSSSAPTLVAPSARAVTATVEPSMSPGKTTAPIQVASIAMPSAPGAVGSAVQTSYAVVPVVVGGSPQGSAPAGNLTLVITPQDVNLRNALDRWLQQQGWQLAWKIDDDLPLEFNATFSGDFDSLLTQVMRATNHMRTPTRICEHTNNVVRVVARAANCQD